MKSIISNTKGQLDINLAVTAILGLILASAFLVIGIVVMQGVVNGGDINAAVAATGTLTATNTVTANELVNISTETYTFTNGTGGAFNVDIGAGTGNKTYAITQLVNEIAANSTLVTAVDNTDSATITSIIAGTAGNAYATTENMTNGAFGAATLTGGVDADTLYATMTSVTDDIGSAMALAGTLILVIIGVAILMLLAGVMVVMRAFR